MKPAKTICNTGASSPGGGEGRFFTWRSLLFGAIGVVLMAGVAAYHDDVFCTQGGGSAMIGNHMPGGAFAYFIFVGLIWNGLCVALKRRQMALNTREMAVVLGMTLVACHPATDGFFSYFFRVLMLPWQEIAGQTLWNENGILTDKYLMKSMFPAPWPGDGVNVAGYDEIYRGYFTGLAKGVHKVAVWNLPFKAWIGPILTWGPPVIAGALAMIALQFIVHRQWSEHEQLPYPVAQVARSFCQTKDGGRGVPAVFTEKLFWWGFIPVALFLAWRLISNWTPEYVPGWNHVFPNLMTWGLPFKTLFPILNKVPNNFVWYFSAYQPLMFSIVALVYFISSDVALSTGLSLTILLIFCSLYFTFTGEMVDESFISSSRFGASLGLCVMLIYAGRTYYKAVFRRALGMRLKRTSGDGAEMAAEANDDYAAITAARVFLVAALAFYVIVAWYCGSWLL
ncbi:MAG: hypothetical protein FWG05_05830, partial [Kiritimatiellaeota bacterium]|nr:hypothetical protein [Kiritimatiellota bacterium]